MTLFNSFISSTKKKKKKKKKKEKKKKKGPKMGVIKVSKDKYISRGVDSEKLIVLD